MNFWKGKNVVVTGHTGFKGGWLCLWLLKLGARVTGLALPPDTKPALFDQLNLRHDIDHRIVDIRDSDAVVSTISEIRPDIVMHLAAQALVLRGYRMPVNTWSTNVMGTVNVLEALRLSDKPSASVLVTTDKVYQNRGWEFGYRETDRLGGFDPYGASKAAIELAIACWRKSYLSGTFPARIASARAGNVIGGGDWSENRIVPDLVRALRAGHEIELRNPLAVRPWQHVLVSLSGYLLLAERLYQSDAEHYQDSFNFGPAAEAERTVRDLAEECLRHWPGKWRDVSNPMVPHEDRRLALSIERARNRLGWAPCWDFSQAVRETIEWYRQSIAVSSRELRELSIEAIRNYETSQQNLSGK